MPHAAVAIRVPLIACVAAACAGSPASSPAVRDLPPSPEIATDPSFGSCERRHPGVGARPVEAIGSRIALARDGGRLFAYAADEETHTLQLLDVQGSRLVGSTPLSAAPEQALVLPDGRVVVALGGANALEVLEPTSGGGGRLELLCRREVPAGPFGLALSRDGSRLVVTSRWAGAVSVFDARTIAPIRVVATGRAPASVVVTDDDRAFVSHVVGAGVSVIDLDATDAPARWVPISLRAATQEGDAATLLATRSGSQGYALASIVTLPKAQGERDGGSGQAPPAVGRRERIVIPMVSVDPGDLSRPSELYYGPPPTAGIAKQTPVVAVLDTAREASLSTHVLATTRGPRHNECMLPRAAAYRAKAGRLYVACAGSNQLLELDARATDPMRAVITRWGTPSGPVGVAVAEPEAVALVLGRFERVVRIVPLDDTAEARDIALEGSAPLERAVREGRELFHRTDDPRISRQGFACASCHPDGGDDGLTWITPDGPRQTLMLAGRVHGSAPYGWTRKQDTLDGYIADTTRRIGNGLPAGEALLVARYVETLAAPKPSERRGDIARGRVLFEREGCTECHAAEGGMPGARTLPTGVPADGSATFDVPSLRRVGMTAPYFHDGRYATLEALLSDPKSPMPNGRHLDPKDRAALRTFLEAL